MNILVTGAGGYIGRGVTKELLGMGHTVVDLCRSIRRRRPEAGHVYVYGELYDIPRLLELIREHKIERIVHIAAQSSPSVSLDVPLQTIHTNIDGTAALLEAARLSGIKRVVLYSSDAAYGEHGDEPITLTSPLLPRTPYGVTKAATEMLGRAYNYSFGMECVSLRVGMVYGGDQLTANWVKSAVECAVRGEKYRLECGADQSLEMVHIDDVVYCTLAALFAERINDLAVYNVVSHCVKLRDALAEIARQVPGFEYDVGPGKLTENQGVWDISETERDFGFRPKYTLSEGLEKYIIFMRELLSRAEMGAI